MPFAEIAGGFAGFMTACVSCMECFKDCEGCECIKIFNGNCGNACNEFCTPFGECGTWCCEHCFDSSPQSEGCFKDSFCTDSCEHICKSVTILGDCVGDFTHAFSVGAYRCCFGCECPTPIENKKTQYVEPSVVLSGGVIARPYNIIPTGQTMNR